MRDLIRDLESWYAGHCDGSFEHDYRIHIGTIDNPGWSVDINVAGTVLENFPLSETLDERSEDDWIQYFIEDRVFKGRGGPRNLAEILSTFLDWADRATTTMRARE